MKSPPIYQAVGRCPTQRWMIHSDFKAHKMQTSPEAKKKKKKKKKQNKNNPPPSKKQANQ